MKTWSENIGVKLLLFSALLIWLLFVVGVEAKGCQLPGCVNLVPDKNEARRILNDIGTGANDAWAGANDVWKEGHQASKTFAGFYLKGGVAVANAIAYVPNKIREEVTKKRPKTYKKSKTPIRRVKPYASSKIAFKASYGGAVKASAPRQHPKVNIFKKRKRAEKVKTCFKIDLSGLRGASF